MGHSSQKLRGGPRTIPELPAGFSGPRAQTTYGMTPSSDVVNTFRIPSFVSSRAALMLSMQGLEFSFSATSCMAYFGHKRDAVALTIGSLGNMHVAGNILSLIS